MKALFVAGLITILATRAAFSQGIVLFDNQNITTGPARIVSVNEPNGLSGTNWSAQLYSAPGLNQPASSLTAAETRVQFRTGQNAGFVATAGNNAFTGLPIDAEVTVTPVINGPATIQLRAWDSRFPTYEAALAGGGSHGFTAPISLLQTGGGLLPPVELTGLGPIPEPSTLAIGAFGLAALLFRRRS